MKNVWRGGHWSAAKYVEVDVLQPAAAAAPPPPPEAAAAAVSPQLLHFNFLEKAAAGA